MAEWLTGNGRRAYFKQNFTIHLSVEQSYDTLFRFAITLTNNGALGYFFHLRIPLSALLLVQVHNERVFPHDLAVEPSSDAKQRRFVGRFFRPKRTINNTLFLPHPDGKSHLVRSIEPGASYRVDFEIELDDNRLTIPHYCFYEIERADTTIQAQLYGVTSNIIVFKP